MFLKIVLLCVFIAVSASLLNETPDSLKQYFDYINTDVRKLESTSMGNIIGSMYQLDDHIDEAIRIVEQNLTDAAQPYWDNITSLEEAAKEIGQNISECVDSGNSRLYEFNVTINYVALQAFASYNYSGYRLVNDSRIQAYSVIHEVQVLSDVVYTCKDDTCATTIKTLVEEYYERVKCALNDAEVKIGNYVTLYLPRLLVLYPFNYDLYVTRYTDILNDVIYCIDNSNSTIDFE